MPSPKRAAVVLFGSILTLAALYAASRAAWHAKGFDLDIYPMRLVDLNGEGNLPALFSGLQLFAASALLACLAKAEPKEKWAWGVLSAGFLFLSLDEWLGFHERASHVMKFLGMGGRGAFHFAWVIPYGLAAAGLLAVYVPFLKRLPLKTSLWYVVAGALYVGGAVGCEMVSGGLVEAYGAQSPAMSLEILIEETMEMSGIALFISQLLARWRDVSPDFSVRLLAPR